MLRVTIELLPFGSENGKRHLGTIDIANDGRGTRERGDYMVRLAKFGRPATDWKKGAVRDFPRLTLGPYDLLLRALLATVGSRNRALVAELREDGLKNMEASDGALAPDAPLPCAHCDAPPGTPHAQSCPGVSEFSDACIKPSTPWPRTAGLSGREEALRVAGAGGPLGDPDVLALPPMPDVVRKGGRVCMEHTDRPHVCGLDGMRASEPATTNCPYCLGAGRMQVLVDGAHQEQPCECTHGVPGVDPLNDRNRNSDDRLRDAPLGTRAPANMGGAWCKVERGWKWNGPHGSGGTFPRPGGDWTGKLIPEQQWLDANPHHARTYGVQGTDGGRDA